MNAIVSSHTTHEKNDIEKESKENSKKLTMLFILNLSSIQLGTSIVSINDETMLKWDEK